MPDTPLQDKKTVLQILESFKGTGPLRELMANLNYDPLNEAVSRSDWPDGAKAALAQDPRLYGRAGGEFYVIYAQLTADKLKLTDERAVVPQLLKQYPYALFVFSDKSQTNFHFVNVKWENTQKRRLYRRITVGPQERLRTAVERITLLDIQTIHAGLFGVKAQEIQDRHDLSFDVAKVTKDFYEEYKRVFEIMRDAIKGFGASDEEQERRHLFTQRLFNRLMFLRFIQKKGWLTIDGSTDYLAALWASHGKLKQDGKNFYEDRLKFLFAALDNEQAGIVLQGKGGAVEVTIGKVKYLNGGLFEKTAEDNDPKVRIADAPFKQIFDKTSGLFEAFNFTITESTPLDVEIAVDPEMLGKIFEELVTGRHDSGSYYTPKPIVSFMCREALKGYLETQVAGEQKAAIERFIDKHEPDDIHNAEAVLNALRRVTVCDPACGSGAYLLGMMHELLDLRQCLFQTRQVDNKTMYQRKLDIIQTNIYGVDLAEFAVNIARLRLWLSLSVDFDGPAPEPLPNLDYKIEVGDSICSPSPGALQMGLQQPLVDQFLELKKRYLVAHHADKQTLRAQVDGLRKSIMSFSNRDGESFDWVIDFAEVFVSSGFDIVIANPPYVRQELITDLKPVLKRRFPLVYSGAADLLCYFYARGYELLKDGGQSAFISSNKWLRAVYGTKLRRFLSERCEINNIVDFGDLPVFEGAIAYPVIVTSQRSPQTRDETSFARVRTLDPPYPEILMLMKSISQPIMIAQGAADWDLPEVQNRATVGSRTVPLSEYLTTPFFRGVLTGLNEAFVIKKEVHDALVAEDRHSLELLRPFGSGKTITRWTAKSPDRYIVFTRRGVNIDKYPAIKKHLEQYRTQLEPKPASWPPKNKPNAKWPGRKRGTYKWYEIQDETAYFEEFERPKIVYQKFQVKPVFCYDRSGMFVNDATFFIPTDDLYLLGIFNSNRFWDEVRQKCTKIQSGHQLMKAYMQRCRVPIPTDKERTTLVGLVKVMISESATSQIEQELNAFVDILYRG